MEQMLQLAQQGRVDKQQALIMKRSRQEMFDRSAAAGVARPSPVSLFTTLVVSIGLVRWFA
jgi:hypothetical protein